MQTAAECAEDMQRVRVPDLGRVLHPGQRQGGVRGGLQGNNNTIRCYHGQHSAENPGHLQEVLPTCRGQARQAVRLGLPSPVFQLPGDETCGSRIEAILPSHILLLDLQDQSGGSALQCRRVQQHLLC